MPFLFLDRFSGPDGELNGHLPNVGPAWAGSTSDYDIDTNRLICTAVAGFVTLTQTALRQDICTFQTHMIVPAGVATAFMIFRGNASQTDENVLLITKQEAPEQVNVQIWSRVAGVDTVILNYNLPGLSEGSELKILLGLFGQEMHLVVNGRHDQVTDPAEHSGEYFRITSAMTDANSFQWDFVSFNPSAFGVNQMINLRSGQWNLHREGVAALLAIAGQALCAGTAAAVTAELRLWTSANEPACDDAVADYTEATFSGYAPVVVDSGEDGCTDILEIGVNESLIGQIVVDQQAWTEADPATITETVNGAYLVLIIDETEYLLATFLFPAAAGMSAPGDILKVNGFALLDCQMAPA